MNQVAKDKELLDLAQGCFQFVTKFFEVIKVSAPHIYHSALELCPMSSIVRKHYYRRHIARSPKVAIGTPDSWDPTTAISGKDHYNGLCTWSQCGRFVAAQTRTAVEIRNQLTLELITTLRSPNAIPHLTGPLAYSPDGRSLACASDTVIVIWDIRTGGVAAKIECSANNLSLVWSSDGRKICTISLEAQVTLVVHMYNVFSGTMSSPGTLQSREKPHLWMHDGSFRVMAVVGHGGSHCTIGIFEVGSTLTELKSFSIKEPGSGIRSFSPTTHCISVSVGDTLCILDIRNSKRLLDGKGNFIIHCFSSDGSFFAASHQGGVYVWERVSDHYIMWRVFQCQGWSNSPLQLSPTSSSILGHSGNILQVLRLHELPTVIETRRQQYVGLSRSGTHVATAHKLESTVTIINLLTQTPSQSIDTGVVIEGLVLTGNILLVVGSGKLVAWLLTEEGLVDGVIGDRRADRSDSIWDVQMPQWDPDWWIFLVEGQLGVVQPDGDGLHVYHTETGEVLHPTQAPEDFNSRWYHFSEALWGQHYLLYHNLCQRNIAPEDSWQTSRATLEKGWVKDPEGKHRLWVPIDWRTDWDPEDWRHDATTQFSNFGGRPVLIKF